MFKQPTELPFELYLAFLRKKIELFWTSDVTIDFAAVEKHYPTEKVVVFRDNKCIPGQIQMLIDDTRHHKTVKPAGAEKQEKKTSPKKKENSTELKKKETKKKAQKKTPATEEPKVKEEKKTTKPRRKKKEILAEPVVQETPEPIVVEQPKEQLVVVYDQTKSFSMSLLEILQAEHYAAQNDKELVVRLTNPTDEEYFRQNINDYLLRPITIDETNSPDEREYFDVDKAEPFNKSFIRQVLNIDKIDEVVRISYGNLSDYGAIHIVRDKTGALTVDDIRRVRTKFSDDDFIVFTDDVRWAQETFAGFGIRFRNESSSPLIDLFAASKCYATIMGDSTFAWLSSILSERPGHITVYKGNEFKGDAS